MSSEQNAQVSIGTLDGLDVATLCTRGYFPKELPPIFSCVDLGSNVGALPTRQPQTTQLMRVNIARPGEFRRRLSVPNPESFIDLARCIVAGAPELSSYIDRSSLSLSQPTPSTSASERSLMPRVHGGELERTKLKFRRSGRVLAYADIGSCYPSMYTHTIPWAIHTKDTAKARRFDTALLGNRLDRLVQASQHGQTLGIPVGPDTSFLIAETVLSAIDVSIRQRLGQDAEHILQRGFRFFDDFYFSCSSRGEAERILDIIDLSCQDYELHLNPRKIKIADLPLPIGELWPSRIRARTEELRTPSDAIRLHDEIVLQMKANPSRPVLKYALRCLSRGGLLRGETWKTWEAAVLHLAEIEPQALTALIPHLYVQGHFISGKVQEFLCRVIDHHGERGHDSEVLWALFGAYVLGVSIPGEAVRVRVSPILGAALPFFIDKGVIVGNSSHILEELRDRLSDPTIQDGIQRSEWWLAAYEASALGQGLSVQNTHIDNDPFFSAASSAQVSFMDRASDAGALVRSVWSGVERSGMSEDYDEQDDDSLDNGAHHDTPF